MTASSMPDSNSSNSGQPAAEPVTFEQLGVPEPLVRVLRKDGKTSAFPIQRDTLPDALAGRDILGRGRTGSGKTLAFSIPLVARLAADEGGRATHGRGGAAGSGSLPRPRGLVLAPTRELANQIDEVLNPLAQAYGMRTCTVYGGVGQGRQVDALRRGAKIVVACPGRLEDLLRQRKLSLEGVEIAVLDEADEMADMGFLPAVERILAQVRPGGQRMLFSATLDHGVDAVVKRFLKDPKIHEVDSATQHVDLMTHHIFETTQAAKHDLVRTLAAGQGKRILFTRTKFQAKKLAKNLIDNGIPAVQLHGNLSQGQRDRNLKAFSEGLVRVMVATDVAARGMDVSGVDLVVQVDPPADYKSFLHRSGRTARAGHSGDVVTVVLPDQRRDTRRMLRMAHIDAKPVGVTANSQEVGDLVGPHAPLVEGWSLEAAIAETRGSQDGKQAGSRGRRSGGPARRRRGYDRFDRRPRGSGRGRDGDGRNPHRKWADGLDEDRPFDGRRRHGHADSDQAVQAGGHRGRGNRGRAGTARGRGCHDGGRFDDGGRTYRNGDHRHRGGRRRRDNNPFRQVKSR
ncbi:DEAD/DEAH box helicase [Bifidobacterium sp. W8113]|nr:DEAD/DEAH box helicase [Bifidobacterium choladohabitans]